ncbi:MAG: histidine phosphatase family protein [Clostridia bacterium]|nr:histidine phosphatase family protein [Clostridia bacterium]
MQSYVIHFVRHGMTDANINGKFAGSGDLPLCSEGVEKLKKLAQDFEYPRTMEYYSSPMKRCTETCKILYSDVEPEIVDGFRECVFSGTEDLRDDPKRKAKVETWDEIQKRVTTTFDAVVESMMRRGVTSATIFTHGGVIMTLLYCYGLPKAEFLDWMVDNGCGYSVRITPSLWMRDKVFEVYDKIPRGADVSLSRQIRNLIDNINNDIGKEEKNE